jgi:uncharacterized protein (DUF433 family)
VAAAGSLIHDAQMTVNGIIGVGVYTVPQASRLTRVSSARIRRWLRGYEFARKDGRGRSAPVWRAQLPKVDDTIALGFLDLMEVRFVDAFLEAGLSLKKIRRAAKLATELVGRDHPFSTQKFRTDGKRIFAEIEHDDRKGDKSLYDLEQHQFGIYEVIVPSLLEGVEFDDEGQATRWRPDRTSPLVIIDPQRQFGQPIVEGGVQTAVLADAVRAEGSVDAVARWYEIPREAVEQAIRFEFRRAA